jgi:hypothetical protein
VLIRQCLAYLAELVASTYPSRAIDRCFLYAMLAIIPSAFMVIIFEDCRITVNGLVFVLLGLGTHVSAIAVIRSHGKLHFASTQAANPGDYYQTLPQFALVISICITGG